MNRLVSVVPYRHVCGGRRLARCLYCRRRHPLARNNRVMPSDPRASHRRPGMFIRTPGEPANTLLSTGLRAKTLRDSRPDGSPILWAMVAANVRYITPPPRVHKLVGVGGKASGWSPSHAHAPPRVEVNKAGFYQTFCFTFIIPRSYVVPAT